MDPSIMKIPHHSDHLSRLKADVGLDALEAELAPIRGWSFRGVLEQIRHFTTGKRFSHTTAYAGTIQHLR
jgi:hypothetical protein